MKNRPYWLRNADAPEQLELFLVTAVASLLLIRGYLAATGYPQVGNDTLHIAHMLWGGLLMLAALIIVFAFVGRAVQRFAAFLAGLGFGAFIDELGKFITQDNDYFYEPAIGIIYIVFIAVFLVLRTVRRRRDFTPHEYLANALDLLRTHTNERLDAHTRQLILGYLARADPTDPLVRSLERHVGAAEPTPTAGQALYYRVRDALFRRYAALVRLRHTYWILGAVFGVQAVLQIGTVADVLMERQLDPTDFGNAAPVVSATVAAAFALIGLVRMVGSRLSAYVWWWRALLVQLFVTQVFVFFHSQLAAVTGLLGDLLLLAALHYLIEQERRIQRERAVPEARPKHDASDASAGENRG